MLTAAQRRRADEHIATLGRRHRVIVHRTKTWATSEAEITYRQVWVPARIRTGMDYMAALHELGHIIDPAARKREVVYQTAHDSGESRRGIKYELLLLEAAAWAWAVKTALPSILRSITPAEWSRIGKCWASHAGDVW